MDMQQEVFLRDIKGSPSLRAIAADLGVPIDSIYALRAAVAEKMLEAGSRQVKKMGRTIRTLREDFRRLADVAREVQDEKEAATAAQARAFSEAARLAENARTPNPTNSVEYRLRDITRPHDAEHYGPAGDEVALPFNVGGEVCLVVTKSEASRLGRGSRVKR